MLMLNIQTKWKSSQLGPQKATKANWDLHPSSLSSHKEAKAVSAAKPGVLGLLRSDSAVQDRLLPKKDRLWTNLSQEFGGGGQRQVFSSLSREGKLGAPHPSPKRLHKSPTNVSLGFVNGGVSPMNLNRSRDAALGGDIGLFGGKRSLQDRIDGVRRGLEGLGEALGSVKRTWDTAGFVARQNDLKPDPAGGAYVLFSQKIKQTSASHPNRLGIPEAKKHSTSHVLNGAISESYLLHAKMPRKLDQRREVILIPNHVNLHKKDRTDPQANSTSHNGPNNQSSSSTGKIYTFGVPPNEGPIKASKKSWNSIVEERRSAIDPKVSNSLLSGSIPHRQSKTRERTADNQSQDMVSSEYQNFPQDNKKASRGDLSDKVGLKHARFNLDQRSGEDEVSSGVSSKPVPHLATLEGSVDTLIDFFQYRQQSGHKGLTGLDER